MKWWLNLLLVMTVNLAFAQSPPVEPPVEPPFKRFPSLPPLTLLLGDSTTTYNKDSLPKSKPVLFMLFSTFCDHCQHTAEELFAKREQLKGIHIVMATLNTISEMNAFVKTYQLDQMSNVVVGKDLYFFMVPFFNIKQFPYLAFYGSNGQLIEGRNGVMSVEKMLEVLNPPTSR
jgi:thioredoxin-related protein